MFWNSSKQFLLFFSDGGGFSGVLAVALLLEDRERLVFKLLLDFSLVGTLLGNFLFGEPGDPFISYDNIIIIKNLVVND